MDKPPTSQKSLKYVSIQYITWNLYFVYVTLDTALFIIKHTIDGRQLTKGNMKMVSINLASIYTRIALHWVKYIGSFIYEN